MFKTDAFVEERHRHRYEVNPYVVPLLTKNGLRFVGMGVDEKLDKVNKDRHLPATTSSAELAKIAAASSGDKLNTLSEAVRISNGINYSNIFFQNADEALLQKVTNLCDKGGNGVAAPAVRMEIVELQGHPYFVGVQYHPEYLSTPFHPSPPFLGLILASIGKLNNYLEKKFASEIEQITEGVIVEPPVCIDAYSSLMKFLEFLR
jgi:CTP synthase